MHFKLTMPIGIITVADPDKPEFIFTTENMAERIEKGHHVTIWSYHMDSDSLSRAKGVITDITDPTATLLVTETDTDPWWPPELPWLLPHSAVYAATPGTYRPCGQPTRNLEDMDLLQDILTDHGPQISQLTPIAFTWIPVSHC